ncbi:hypothetical protein DR73_2375 [Enterobacteriaceae bacterium ATCC 29904]|nr:hypothetical protein DR73_2375 [Enterobacteriaceae bacterium ATCC 29904]
MISLPVISYLKVYGGYLLQTQSHGHCDAVMQVIALIIRMDCNKIYLSNL